MFHDVYEFYFILADGILMYVTKDGKGRRCIFTDEGKDLIFQECHESKQGSHLGINRTLHKASRRYYWLGMSTDLTNRVKKCAECKNKFYIEKINSMTPELQSTLTNSWQILGSDLIGPLPKTNSGCKYILAITDLFTKYVVAFPLPNKEVECVCTSYTKLFFQYGPPGRIISNQDGAFVNALNKLLVSKFSINNLITSAYHLQTDEKNERANQAIKTALTKLVNENQDNWDTLLNSAVFGINTCEQSSTKFSPFYLMYGREPRLFSELSLQDV